MQTVSGNECQDSTDRLETIQSLPLILLSLIGRRNAFDRIYLSCQTALSLGWKQICEQIRILNSSLKRRMESDINLCGGPVSYEFIEVLFTNFYAHSIQSRKAGVADYFHRDWSVLYKQSKFWNFAQSLTHRLRIKWTARGTWHINSHKTHKLLIICSFLCHHPRVSTQFAIEGDLFAGGSEIYWHPAINHEILFQSILCLQVARKGWSWLPSSHILSDESVRAVQTLVNEFAQKSD
jgi:hypothetical protein